MMHIPFIDELAIIVAVSVLVTLVLGRVRLPVVAGLLVAGAMVGPNALALVKVTATVEAIAEIGVVLLLFTVGLELPMNRLRPIIKQVVVGGTLQMGLTIGATAGVALALGEPLSRALFWGFVVAMSSTALVLRSLNERREIDAPHGRFILGVLLFQDLSVVPMVLLVPLLAALPGTGDGPPIGLVMVEAVVVVVAVIFGARALVPRLLRLIDTSRSREAFLLAVLSLCIGTAWITAQLGLSLALGAFLGGVVVAETQFAHRALADVLPLRDAFVSVFFVSLGMLFDPGAILSHPLLCLALFAAFVLGKGAIATLAALAMRFPPRAAWLAGVGLAQFSEFGFVLARLGTHHGVASDDAMRPVLAAGIMSMFVTPLLMRGAPHIRAGERILAPLARLLGARSIAEAGVDTHRITNHVVIIGYGLGGQLLARALNASGVPHIVLELNEATVRSARKAGEPVFYADATSPEALTHAHVERARAAVVLVNDGPASERIVDAVKRAAPGVPVLLRARYHAERERLMGIGATDVVSEEVEAGIEMLARVLRRLEVPRNSIDGLIREARSVTQKSDRTVTIPRRVLPEIDSLGDLKIECVLLHGGSHAVGRTIATLQVRTATGALIVALRRDGALLDHPDPHAPLREGDVVYLAGTGEAVRAAMELMDEPLDATQAG